MASRDVVAHALAVYYEYTVDHKLVQTLLHNHETEIREDERESTLRWAADLIERNNPANKDIAAGLRRVAEDL